MSVVVVLSVWFVSQAEDVSCHMGDAVAHL